MRVPSRSGWEPAGGCATAFDTLVAFFSTAHLPFYRNLGDCARIRFVLIRAAEAPNRYCTIICTLVAR